MALRSCFIGISILVPLILLSGCVPTSRVIQLDPDINETIVHFHKPVVPHEHNNYALTELYRGQMFRRLGDCLDSDTRFANALGVMDQIRADNREATAVAIDERRKTFRGEPYERATAYLYRGICQFNRGNYEAALSAFRNSLARDEETRTDQQKHKEDFTISHFLAALCYERLGEPENAEAVLKVANLHASENPYITRSHLQKNFIAVIELGRGPYVAEGAFWSKEYKCGPCPEDRVELLFDTKPFGEAAEAIDLLQQAESQTWGDADSAAVARGAGKFVLNVFVSAVIGRDAGIKEERDLRCWHGLQVNGLPRKFYIFAADVPPGLHTIGLKFYDSKGNPLERYEQVWYEVPVYAEKGKIFCASSIPNLHNVNGLDLQPLQEVLEAKRKQRNSSKTP